MHEEESVWGRWGMVLFVAFVVYVLAFGPAVKYAYLLPVPGEAWNVIYRPVVWMGMHSHRFEFYMSWYCVHVWEIPKVRD